MRISYFLENNFLVKSSEEVDEYVQFGKDAIAPYMFNHNINLSFHAGSAVGVRIGFMFRPGLLRNDLDYTYQFMSQYEQQVKDTYMFTFRFWGDFRFAKRKESTMKYALTILTTSLLIIVSCTTREGIEADHMLIRESASTGRMKINMEWTVNGEKDDGMKTDVALYLTRSIYEDKSVRT